MRVAVLSFSGNVGKSTIAKHLILANSPTSVYVSVETINSDTGLGENALQVTGNNVEVVQENLLLEDNLIVDIGASNIEQFLKSMKLFHGSIHDFDQFIIPVTPEQKQQIDSVATIKALLKMEIPPSKIKVIFNRVQQDMDIELQFHALIGYLKSEKISVPKASVPDTPFFEKANDLGFTINEVVEDKTDYRALLRTEEDPDEKKVITEKILLGRSALGVKTQLDEVAKGLS